MRKWKETISPKQANDFMGCYEHGTWLKEMDRCWMSDDGYQVTSRLLFTEWGKVEHAAITYNPEGFANDENIDMRIERLTTNDGSRDISWNTKQEIKNELWGKDRVAIEVFPQEKNLINAIDCYHLWIMPKGFKMPFGIHPTKDVQCKVINRGVPKIENINYLIENSKNLLNK